MNNHEDNEDEEDFEEYETPTLDNIVVRLVFRCSPANRGLITNELGIAPDEELQEGWSHTRPTTDDSFSLGTFDEWRDLLLDRADALKRLRLRGLQAFLHIWVIVPEHVQKYFAARDLPTVVLSPEFIGVLGSARIALEIEHNQDFKLVGVAKVPEAYVLEIDGSCSFLHENDETMLFFWLNNIPAIKSITGHGRSLYLGLDTPFMDDESLRSLIACMRRYKLDLSFLRSQICESNMHWLNNPDADWYNALFGAQKKTKRHRPEFALARFVSNAEKFEKANNPTLTLHNYEAAVDIIRRDASPFDSEYVESVVTKYVLALRENKLFDKASEVEEQIKMKTLYSPKTP